MTKTKDQLAEEAARQFCEDHGLREHFIAKDLERKLLSALNEFEAQQRAAGLLLSQSSTGSVVSVETGLDDLSIIETRLRDLFASTQLGCYSAENHAEALRAVTRLRLLFSNSERHDATGKKDKDLGNETPTPKGVKQRGD